MIKVLPTKEGHLDFFEPREVFHGEDAKESILKHLANKNAYLHTLIYENEVLGVVGVVTDCKGMMEGVACFSDSVKKCGKLFTEKVIDIQSHYEKALHIRRSQIFVRADNEVANKWALTLGYKKEALLEAWGSTGEDYNLYVRILKKEVPNG